MPILKENKARYPKNWPEIRDRIHRRGGNACENCGVADGAVGARGYFGKWFSQEEIEEMDSLEILENFRRYPKKMIKIVLTVAHLNHRPEDCRDENLRLWCQRCHNRHDAKHRVETRKRRRNQRQLWLIAL